MFIFKLCILVDFPIILNISMGEVKILNYDVFLSLKVLILMGFHCLLKVPV